MSHTISNASLQGIYDRLSNTPQYHPLDAETYADWSQEAGDMVTLSRDNNSYTSPVQTQTVTWKKGQQTSVSSTGNQTRDAISKVSSSKYNSGSSSLRTTKKVYDSILVSYDNMVSGLEAGIGWVSVYAQDLYAQMKAGLDLTSSSASLYVESKYDQMKSGLDLTMSSASLYVESKYDQMKSGLDLTSSTASLYVDSKYDQMKSGLDLTSSTASLYVDSKYDQMKSGLDLTSSTASLYVDSKYDQMKAGLDLTSSTASFYVQSNYDMLKAGLDLTSSSAAVYVRDMYTQMQSGLDVTSSSAAVYARSRTNRAFIMARINANGEGEDIIQADKVSINGTTKINDVFTITDNNLISLKNLYMGDQKIKLDASTGNITAEKYTVGLGNTVDFRDSGAVTHALSASDVSGMVIKADFDPQTNTLSLWTHGADTSGTPTISFSKATAVSGSWGGTIGNVFTARPDANGTPTTSATVYPEIVGTNLHDYFYARVITYNDDQPVQRGNPLYGYLIETTSGNNHYVDVNTASDGSGITVARLQVNGGSISTVTLTGAWSNNQYIVTAKDQNNQTVGSLPYSPLMELAGDTSHGYFNAQIYELVDGRHESRKSVLGQLHIVGSGASSKVQVNTQSDLQGQNVASIDVGFLYTNAQNATGLAINTTTHKITREMSSDAKEYTIGLSVGAFDSTSHNAEVLVTATPPGGTATNVIVGTAFGGTVYTQGQNSVSIHKGDWNSGSVSFTKSAGTGSSVGVTLAQGTSSWSNNVVTVPVLDYNTDTGFSVVVNAGSIYTDGQNNVTITKGSWNNGSISFTKSAGTASTKSVTLAQGTSSWSNNVVTVPVLDGSTSTGFSVIVNAASIYTNGQNSVTITKGSWSNGSISFTKSAGTASTKSVTLVQGTASWSNNVVTVPVLDNKTSTGFSVIVNAASIYTNGQNSVTINKGSWSNGSISFTKSAGTASTKGVTLAQGTASWNNNVVTVPVLDNTTATGFSVIVNAGTIYTNGQNSVAINKGAWSNGTISFTKSAGTASTKSVTLQEGTESWSGNTVSVPILDSGAATGLTISVNAVGRYNAGWADAHSKAAWPSTGGTLVDNFTFYNPSGEVGKQTSRPYYITFDTPVSSGSGANKTYSITGYVRQNGPSSSKVAKLTQDISRVYNDGYNTGKAAGGGSSTTVTIDITTPTQYSASTSSAGGAGTPAGSASATLLSTLGQYLRSYSHGFIYFKVTANNTVKWYTVATPT